MIRKESEYHELSYLEKREKEREFGKLYKEIKKYKDITYFFLAATPQSCLGAEL